MSSSQRFGGFGAEHALSARPLASADDDGGQHRWGSLELPDLWSTGRTGIARYRLRVYRPGTSAQERRDLLVAHRWWAWGAVAALVAEILSGAIRSGWPAALLVVCLYLAIALYWAARTRGIRAGSRFLRVAVVLVGGPPCVSGDSELLERCRRMLRRADHAAADGELTPVQYELVWSDVYDLVGCQVQG